MLFCRSAHLVSRYRPRAPIIALTRNAQTARQAHLYRGIFPVLYTTPAHEVWAEDVDMRVNFAMDMGMTLMSCFQNSLKNAVITQLKDLFCNLKKYLWHFRQSPRLLQRRRYCHRPDRLAPRFWFHQHHACGSSGVKNREATLLSPFTFHLCFIAQQCTPAHSLLSLQ